YALIAIVVLLVAAGIASYAATVPSGSPTHGVLYVNTIFGKGTGNIDVNDTLTANRGVVVQGATGMAAVIGSTGLSDKYGVMGLNSHSGGIGVTGMGGNIGVVGTNSATGNAGSLGTADAGVEGTGTIGIKGAWTGSPSNVFGMLGSSDVGGTYGAYGYANAAGAIGIKGQSDGGIGVSGQSNTGTGAMGNSNSGRGVFGSSFSNDGVRGESSTGNGVFGSGYYGIRGLATNTNGYGGYFSGGKGLYASKIEFGYQAFDTAAQGLLVLATAGSTRCTTICFNHGLACSALTPAPGCDATTGSRYCWCD
ncbi:MAG: hypothetical protein QME12_09530, partial [Nanoarchaeota archaeon]|nr:hypothetical protein [Nanoarchaeota archaeon]